MLRKIIIVILSFLNILFISAMEHESIIEDKWYEEKFTSDLLEVINTETRYRWYKENIVYSSQYYIEEFNPSHFPHKIIDDYIETDFTEWEHEHVPELYTDRVIEERSVNKYRELRPVRYIFFEEISALYLRFRISELRILIDGQSINYDVECTSCSDDFAHYIKNGIINEDNAYVFNGGKFRLDLGAYYGINQVRIELYMYDTNMGAKKAKIYLNEGDTLEDRNYAYQQFITYAVSQTYLVPEQYLIIPDQHWIVNPVYQDWVYIDGQMHGTYFRQMLTGVTETRYKDIMYRYYGIEKDYIEGYHLNIDDEQMIKDEEQYIEYYQYRLIIKEDDNNDHIQDKIEEDNVEQEADDNIVLESKLESVKTIKEPMNNIVEETDKDKSFICEFIPELEEEIININLIDEIDNINKGVEEEIIVESYKIKPFITLLGIILLISIIVFTIWQRKMRRIVV